jgi:hypothetical protein
MRRLAAVKIGDRSADPSAPSTIVPDEVQARLAALGYAGGTGQAFPRPTDLPDPKDCVLNSTRPTAETPHLAECLRRGFVRPREE